MSGKIQTIRRAVICAVTQAIAVEIKIWIPKRIREEFSNKFEENKEREGFEKLTERAAHCSTFFQRCGEIYWWWWWWKSKPHDPHMQFCKIKFLLVCAYAGSCWCWCVRVCIANYCEMSFCHPCRESSQSCILFRQIPTFLPFAAPEVHVLVVASFSRLNFPLNIAFMCDKKCIMAHFCVFFFILMHKNFTSSPVIMTLAMYIFFVSHFCSMPHTHALPSIIPDRFFLPYALA